MIEKSDFNDQQVFMIRRLFSEKFEEGNHWMVLPLIVMQEVKSCVNVVITFQISNRMESSF